MLRDDAVARCRRRVRDREKRVDRVRAHLGVGQVEAAQEEWHQLGVYGVSRDNRHDCEGSAPRTVRAGMPSLGLT